MNEPIQKIQWGGDNVCDLGQLLNRAWLVTNGLGGYASGTVAGVVTRRYHGFLIAALAAPFGRMLMLSNISEQLRLPNGRNVRFGSKEQPGSLLKTGDFPLLTEFWLDLGLPVWQYKVDGIVLEKRVLLLHQQNTVYVTYRLVDGPERVRLKLLPAVHFRSHDAPVSLPISGDYQLSAKGGHYELSAGPNLPGLRMMLYGQEVAFTFEPKKLPQFLYRVEESRGYDSQGDLFSPGYFRVDLVQGRDASLVASTESWETIGAISPQDAAQAETQRRLLLLAESRVADCDKFGGALVLAADQFIVRPVGRVEDAARVRAAGDEVRTVIAGYHWFTDWGRDTMISLEGLTLVTGRQVEAGYILRTFAHYIRDGLIPNLFPEGEREGLYHTADATLWYFHALARYLDYSRDRTTLQLLLPKLLEIINCHLRGTRFGIGVDPSDGLLRQGAEGYQLTWMDAKVDNWVATPRRGKPVEINALWYNTLRLMERWVGEEQGQQAAQWLREHARQAKASFNKRFWYSDGGYLYDVVDGPQGDDSACRPNQIFAFSLDYPVLDHVHWSPVLQVVQDRLLTPVGLRTLAPGHPDYKPQYYGDLRARDSAYHQGTVWAWLIGPFVDAWLRVHPEDRQGARTLIAGFESHLNEACIGTISEIFDAEAPYTPRGTVAQAWSVAEVLRAFCTTVKKAPSQEMQPARGEV
jgi:predicted glycogen debranching enzyme